MATLDASTAHYIFEAGSYGASDLQIADFTGREAISQLWRFHLRLVSTHPDIAFEDVLNKPATFSIMRVDGEEPFHGVVVDFETGHRADSKRVYYEAVLVPRMWALGLTYQSRVFLNKKVQEVVAEVFKKAGFASDDVKWQLKKSYPQREYVVQYRETDLNFVCRLLEHEGMFFWFDHTGGKDVVVISDDTGQFPFIAAPEQVPYRAPTGFAGPVPEHVNAFTLKERLVTGKVLLRDYNYRTPEVNLQAESQLNKSGIGIYYEYGDHFKDTEDGGRYARVRNEEIESMRLTGKGKGDCRGFRAGYKFSLEEHHRDEHNQEYLLLEVWTRGSQARAMGLAGDEKEPTYANEFTCIPANQPYRPPRLTPVPKVPGFLTARIESTGGPYAHLDDMGRYKVRMPFDLSDAPKAGASRPIRLGAPYAGPGYGFHTPSHEGVEMVIACMDGDVDRPMGICVVPNPSQMAPSTGGNKAQSVMRTAGGNEINLDDTGGGQVFLMNASFDHAVNVANNQSINVSVDRTKIVGSNQKESVGADKEISVGANHTESIASNMTLTVGADQGETVGANRKVNVGSNDELGVGSDQTINVGSNHNLTVGINSAESIGVSKELTAGVALAMSGGAMVEIGSGGPVSVDAGASFSASAGSDASVSSGAAMNLDAGGDLQAASKATATIKANSIVIEAKSDITLKAGGAVITLKGGNVSIKGSKVSAKGSGDVCLKGSKVTNN